MRVGCFTPSFILTFGTFSRTDVSYSSHLPFWTQSLSKCGRFNRRNFFLEKKSICLTLVTCDASARGDALSVTSQRNKMVGSQGDAPQRSAIAQLLYNVHGPAMLDQGNTASTGRGTRRRRESRRLSLDSCRHQEGKTRVYVRSKDLNPHGPFVKVTYSPHFTPRHLYWWPHLQPLSSAAAGTLLTSLILVPRHIFIFIFLCLKSSTVKVG